MLKHKHDKAEKDKKMTSQGQKTLESWLYF